MAAAGRLSKQLHAAALLRLHAQALHPAVLNKPYCTATGNTIMHHSTADVIQYTSAQRAAPAALSGFGLSSFVSGWPARNSSMLATVADAMLASASCVRKAEWGVMSTCGAAC